VDENEGFSCGYVPEAGGLLFYYLFLKGIRKEIEVTYWHQARGLRQMADSSEN